MATAGGQAYGAQLFGDKFYHFANNGSYVPIAGNTGRDLRVHLGMWGSTSGKLIASTNLGLAEIDPTTGSYRIINAGVFPDGVSVSPDGKIAYVEGFGRVRACNIATGALSGDYLSTAGHGADRTGVITGGLYDGDVIVDNNDGTLLLLDPTTDTSVIIALDGTRGDFTSADTNNGTLFISQVVQVLRLSYGPGCTIGGPGTVPEPATFPLVMLALAGVGWVAASGAPRVSPSNIWHRIPGAEVFQVGQLLDGIQLLYEFVGHARHTDELPGVGNHLYRRWRR